MMSHAQPLPGHSHRGKRGCRPHARQRSDSEDLAALWSLMRGHRGPFPGPGFGGPGAGPDFSGRRRRRRRRGDVRAAILLLLEEEPRNGYQLIQEIESRSDGAWRPSPGSVYPSLQQLEDEGLVRSGEGGGKKSFELTGDGRAHVAEHREKLGNPFEDEPGMPEGVGELRSLLHQIGMATHQATAGSPEQIESVKTLLDETRRGIHRILAGDWQE